MNLKLTGLIIVTLAAASWIGYSAFAPEQAATTQAKPLRPDGDHPLTASISSPTGEQPKGQEMEAVTLSAVNKELSELKAQVALLKHTLNQQATQAVQSADASTGEHEDYSDTWQDEEEEVSTVDEEQRGQQRLDWIDGELQAEGIDRKWVDEVDAMLRDAFDTALSNKQLRSMSLADVDCRSTLCKVRVTHDNEVNLELLHAELTWPLAGELPRSTMHSEDGSTVIYLARDGFRLPKFEEY